MTPDQIVAIVADARLTPDALRVALFVASLGEGAHEIAQDQFAELLEEAGPRRIRKALDRAGRLGYVERTPGGRGHADRFEFRWPQEADLSDSGAHGAHLSGDRSAQRAHLKRPSSTPPNSPSPTTGAQAREDDLNLVRLRRFLEPNADALDRFAESAAHDPTWPGDVWAMYRPPSGEPNDAGGDEWPIFARHDEETAARALSNALRDYAGKRQKFSSGYFRRFVRTALREIEDEAREVVEGRARASPGRRRSTPEKVPADAQEYTPTTEFKGLNG